MAAYIGLNPVRAGMAGERKAQRGLGTVSSESLIVSGEGEDDWKTTATRYRMRIYDQGEERLIKLLLILEYFGTLDHEPGTLNF